jgi:hypothetical protein
LISDLFFVITSGNRRKSRIPNPAGKIYGSLSASVDHVGDFTPQTPDGQGEDPCERPVHSGTPADFQHSCRSPLNRDFPESRKPRSSGSSALKTVALGRASTHSSRLMTTSCPGVSGHSLKHSLDPAYSLSCAASVSCAETSGVSAPGMVCTAMRLRWTQFDRKIHLRKGGSCRQFISRLSSMKGSVSIRGLYR